MHFQTPQFIEIEDKIFGPLTLKQFIYLAGAAGLSFTAYSLLPVPLALRDQPPPRQGRRGVSVGQHKCVLLPTHR